MKGQLEFLQEAKNEIENFGPNPALLGEGLEDSSGRAIALLQQAGLAELGPFLSAFRNWKIRVYRDIWNIITQHWKSERWIRVTDDEQIAQFFKINELGKNEWGQPAIINAIGSLDVDIILDEGPDQINMMADSASVLQALGPQFAQEFPELAIELSPIQASVKKKMLDKIQQKQNQPPPPDPKVQAAQAMAQIKAQESQQAGQLAREQAMANFQLEQMRADHEMQIERQRAASEMQIERDRAENAVQIEQIKAAATIHVNAVKAEQAAQLNRERMEREPAGSA
jgi:hypothetical protein